jgi:hypothetical protein
VRTAADAIRRRGASGGGRCAAVVMAVGREPGAAGSPQEKRVFPFAEDAREHSCVGQEVEQRVTRRRVEREARLRLGSGERQPRPVEEVVLNPGD